MAESTPALQVNLSEKTAIVTGASQGLGKAVALTLAANGARVACVARSVDKLNETVQQIQDAGGQAEAFACDVTDRESVDGLVDQVVEQWEKLDILVNNAGITRDTLLPRMSDEEWDAVIDTNLRGCFLFSRAASRYMMRARYGRIINMSSVSGLIGNPGQTNYSASKAGMIGLTRRLSSKLARWNTRINA
ncbi:MAG: SDR family NAD(P)-dependent oxidoreductase, partial [Planctomycetaceae bacterium]|nr:SDR family NAD(P)-dependent oxidoreductase [Planctomycetaceae bacterium]